MDIEVHHYQLIPKRKLNSFHEACTRKGVLFRIDYQYYIDYCPWIEFGDQEISKFIDLIGHQNLPPFFESLLELEKNKDEISHREFLNHSFNNMDADVVKLKVSDLAELRTIIKNNRCTFRLDFNNKFSFEDVKYFWGQLSAQEKAFIEYIEDPCPLLHWDELYQLGIPLASDRLKSAVDTVIFKPNIELKPKAEKVIYSSYMGHQLGMYHTYLALMKDGDKELVHGINTPDIFEKQTPLFVQSNTDCRIIKKSIKQMYEKLEALQWKSI